MKEEISNNEIEVQLAILDFNKYADEGRLMLLELLSKAGAGYRNSHTEELFLESFNLMKADRTPNKKGRKFICSMVYESSNKRPLSYYLMNAFRR